MRHVLSASLLLALAACTDGGSDAAEDTADTAVEDTGPAPTADCSFVSASPAVASWSGGDDLTITLDCADATRVESVSVDFSQGAVDATFSASADGTTLKVTVTTEAQSDPGRDDPCLTVDEDTVCGMTTHFRLDPGDIAGDIDGDAIEALDWAYEIAAAGATDDTVVVASIYDDNWIVGETNADRSAWVETKLTGTPIAARPNFRKLAVGQSIHFPALDKSAGKVTVHTGTMTDKGLAFSERTGSGFGLETDADVLYLGSSSKGVVIQGTSAKDGTVVNLGLTLSDTGLDAAWSASGKPALHSVEVTTSHGEGVVLFSTTDKGVLAELIDVATGKVLESTTVELTGVEVMDMAAADLDGDGFDELYGAFATAKGVYPSVTRKGSYYLSFQVAGKKVGSGNFRLNKLRAVTPTSNSKLEKGYLLMVTEPTTTVSLGAERASEGGSTWLATWSTGEAFDMTGVPDSVELVAQRGDTVLARSGEKMTGSPVLFSGAANPVEVPTAADGEDTSLVLAYADDWTVITRGGEVFVVDPDGVEVGESLPMDPGAQLVAVPHEGGLLVAGTGFSEDADGETVAGPGVFSVSADGIGQAFPKTFDRCGWSTHCKAPWSFIVTNDPDAPLATYDVIEVSGGEYERRFGYLDTFPQAGEVLTMDLQMASWGTTSTIDGALPIAAAKGSEATSDVYVVLPDDDATCGLSTWVVPGTTTDAATNLANATRLYTSTSDDCSDLLVPEVALDTDGAGRTSMLMSSGGTLLREVAWTDEGLSEGFDLTVPGFSRLTATDLDGDELDDLVVSGVTEDVSLIVRSDGHGLGPSDVTVGGEELAKGTPATALEFTPYSSTDWDFLVTRGEVNGKLGPRRVRLVPYTRYTTFLAN